MDKKEVKEIKINEVVINHLSGGSDMTGDWETNANIDFILNQSCEFHVFNDLYVIDRINLECRWDGAYLYYANEKHCFHSIPVSNIFIKKVYDELLIVQKEERFKNHSFEDDLMDMLRGEREVTPY